MKQSINDKQKPCNRIPYNGEPLRDGEVLVPMCISREHAKLIGAIGVRTWYSAGIPYYVMFVPVPAEQAGIARKAFNAEVNDYIDDQLGPNRYSRCMIPQSDGSLKPCPKEIDGKYNRCAECPHRGEYYKEDRAYVSLETLDDENYCPMETVPSAEETALLRYMIDDVLRELDETNPLYALITRLIMQGYSTKEIVQMLPQGKSQAYQAIKNCRKFLKEKLQG